MPANTNYDVPDLSMPIPMSELFDDKKTRMTMIERKYKDREEEKIKMDMREENAKTFQRNNLHHPAT